MIPGTDEQLMRSVAEGNLDAFSEIVLRYQQMAWKTAYRFLGNSMEAEDVAQEAFLKMLEAAPRYRATASFCTYLYTIIYRLCADRKKRRSPAYTDTMPDTPASVPGAIEDIVARECEEEVQKALNSLPFNQKTAMVLKHFEGLSYAEIAELMGITLKSVEMLIRRAKEKLQSQLAHLRKG
jgi:RNA polymerase sigma-70 factor (ECF subfamily)